MNLIFPTTLRSNKCASNSMSHLSIDYTRDSIFQLGYHVSHFDMSANVKMMNSLSLPECTSVVTCEHHRCNRRDVFALLTHHAEHVVASLVEKTRPRIALVHERRLRYRDARDIWIWVKLPRFTGRDDKIRLQNCNRRLFEQIRSLMFKLDTSKLSNM